MTTPASTAPLLSVAMIVRDEAAMLPGCLESIQPLEAEICIVDTGSTDNTPAIAGQYGCRVDSFEWRDDFSAARNASLRMCSGRWILVLDADERLGREDIPRLQALLNETPDRCWRMITRNYTPETHLDEFTPCDADDPHARGYPGWYPSGKVRLFPNIPEAEFRGEVHELVNDSLIEARIGVQTSAIPIHHYPFDKSPDAVEAKRRNYIALGRAKLDKDPANPRWHDELGTQYVELGDLVNALKHYREAVRLDPRNPDYLKSMGTTLQMMGRSEEAAKALEIAVQLDPELSDGWRNLGITLMALGRAPEAAGAFEKLLALLTEDSEAHRFLAIARLHCGRKDDARKLIGRALELNPANEEARQFLQSLQTSE